MFSPLYKRTSSCQGPRGLESCTVTRSYFRIWNLSLRKNREFRDIYAYCFKTPVWLVNFQLSLHTIPWILGLESGIFVKKPWDSESCTEIQLVSDPSSGAQEKMIMSELVHVRSSGKNVNGFGKTNQVVTFCISRH